MAISLVLNLKPKSEIITNLKEPSLSKKRLHLPLYLAPVSFRQITLLGFPVIFPDLSIEYRLNPFKLSNLVSSNQSQVSPINQTLVCVHFTFYWLNPRWHDLGIFLRHLIF